MRRPATSPTYITYFVLECGCQKQREGRMTMADEVLDRLYCHAHKVFATVVNVFEGVFTGDYDNGNAHYED